ncbi:30S ribosomal protein S13, partial [Patescibacteria group bacterium]
GRLATEFTLGRVRSGEILDKVKVDPGVRANDLTDDQVHKLRAEIEKRYRVEGELRRETTSNIKRLKEIKSYRGLRHSYSLPARGQRTKTNSRTVRGNVRRTMGSGKSKVEKK